MDKSEYLFNFKDLAQSLKDLSISADSFEEFFTFDNLRVICDHIFSGFSAEAIEKINKIKDYSCGILSEKRYRHTLGCEYLAVLLAFIHKENVENAAAAALLHDITKERSLSDHLILSDKYGIICDAYEKNSTNLLHSKTAASLARDLFQIDNDVFNAIYYHTTGNSDMSGLEKIIFLSDSIEPNRKYDGLYLIRNLSFLNLNSAVALQLSNNIDSLNSRKMVIHISTLTAFDYYKEFLPNVGK